MTELLNKIHVGDALAVLATVPDNSIDCCITSPPYYGLRDYGVAGQIGLEETPEAFIERLVGVFREVRRVLRPDGTLWLNIGDSYAGSGHGYLDKQKGKQATNKGTAFMCDRPPSVVPVGMKAKDLIGIPWMLAFALRADGWYLRQEIIWHKPNPMPESVRDRCTKSHESLFLLAKSPRYYFDHKAIMEPAAYDGRKDKRMKGSHKYSQGVTGLNPQTFAARAHERWQTDDEGRYMRNKRNVWTVPPRPFKGAHFATFPPDLIKPCVLAGCPAGGTVLDPFFGSGTTGLVARQYNRNYIGIDLNPEYVKLAERRIQTGERPFVGQV
jgi:DNA modification methylase